jgi:hypothetical protein
MPFRENFLPRISRISRMEIPALFIRGISEIRGHSFGFGSPPCALIRPRRQEMGRPNTS